MRNRPAERQVTVQLDGRSIRLSGRHAAYLDDLEGTDLSADPLIALARAAPSGSICLDVGANIGATAIPVAMLRPDLRVVAFEAVPDNASFLTRNLAENGIGNCTTVNAAVGSAEGYTTVSEDGPWSRAGLSGPTVPFATIDGWCAQHLSGAQVGLIKIDVEGYEPHVLAGAAETIAAFRPQLLMELNPVCLLLQGFNPVAFARYLLAAFEIEEQAALDRTSAIGLICDAIAYHGNVVNVVMSLREPSVLCDLEEIGSGAMKSAFSRDLPELMIAISGATAHAAVAALSAPVAADEELRAIKHSRSWRWTAPARALRAALPARRSARTQPAMPPAGRR